MSRKCPGSAAPPRDPSLDRMRSIAEISAALALMRPEAQAKSVDQGMRLGMHVSFRQLRTCRRIRPGQLCAISGCEQAQQMATYSITSSARASSVGGTSRPSALAVCRLMTNSNLVDCNTGRSAGFAPLRIRPV